MFQYLKENKVFVLAEKCSVKSVNRKHHQKEGPDEYETEVEYECAPKLKEGDANHLWDDVERFFADFASLMREIHSENPDQAKIFRGRLRRLLDAASSDAAKEEKRNAKR